MNCDPMVVLARGSRKLRKKQEVGKSEMELKVNVNCLNGEFLCNSIYKTRVKTPFM